MIRAAAPVQAAAARPRQTASEPNQPCAGAGGAEPGAIRASTARQTRPGGSSAGVPVSIGANRSAHAPTDRAMAGLLAISRSKRRRDRLGIVPRTYYED